VTVGSVATIAVGSAIGLGLGLTSERYIGELLYQVKATDPNLLALPLITLLGATVLVAVPPVLRAIYLDPGQILRSE
jgi:ABC-type antimicrobial peptide transport system permease subunit